MTEDVLGVRAEVISGDEEARLSFTGAVGDLDPAEGPFVVADVGGGSTELVLGTWDGAKADVLAARSVDIGCVRLTERCLHSDPPTETEIADATRLATEILESAFAAVPVDQASTFIGVAGTVTTLSAVNQELTEYDPEQIHLSRLSVADVRRTAEKLLSLSHAGRAGITVIHPGRVDVIGAGAIVVRTLSEQLAQRAGITEMVVSEHDILDGIALSLA
jgi:exopolyphosphatase/guanosine-5'-triphosphate,3'-diphosphate pyrophosphatase